MKAETETIVPTSTAMSHQCWISAVCLRDSSKSSLMQFLYELYARFVCIASNVVYRHDRKWPPHSNSTISLVGTCGRASKPSQLLMPYAPAVSTILSIHYMPASLRSARALAPLSVSLQRDIFVSTSSSLTNIQQRWEAIIKVAFGPGFSDRQAL